MNKSSASRGVPDLLKANAQWAQTVATASGTKVDLVSCADGLVRCVVSGWPIHGNLLATFAPKRKA